MPAHVEKSALKSGSVRQILTASNDDDFLDALIDGMKTHNHSELLYALDKLSSERDSDIERICTSKHEDFVQSVQKLDKGREDCTVLGKEILNLVQSYLSGTNNLAAQKKTLVDSRSVRQNIDESADALKECLAVLALSNQVLELVAKKNHYAALRSLDELQNSFRLGESSRYKIGEIIEKSIPATQKMIAEAVMSDLNTWLYQIRDISQFIGEVAFYHTEQRRARQKERASKDPLLSSFKLNSPIELVADELEEYSVLDNEEAGVQVDFTPLFECIHIHEALGQTDRFRAEYAVTRRRQKDLIIPASLKLDDEEASELKTLLENIAGFSIVERATMKRTENLRTSVDVDELWDSMCQSAISLISSAMHTVDSAEMLLKITGVVSLFIQTMESWQFYASTLNAFLMTLFERYVQLLKERCSDDFQEIVSTDDYMPMPINNLDEYDRIIDVGWYVPDKDREQISFPTILPYSQMYPMCCIDIRNFLNQVYSAPDDYLHRSSVIDETIKNSLDELLCNKICQPLIERLTSQYPGQIVQILTNLEHFEKACLELQVELASARTLRSRSAPVVLNAVGDFKNARKRAEKRIFELVNSKIDDLISTAEYDWTAKTEPTEPSNYMIELTRYLSDVMSSVLLGLPTEIKELIYFDALSFAASEILTQPLDESVTAITPAALQSLKLDVDHFTTFIDSLSLPTNSSAQAQGQGVDGEASASRPNDLRPTVAELTQTVELMASDPMEFFDIAQRNRKFGSVDAQNGPVLLEKIEQGKLLERARPTGLSLSTSRDYLSSFASSGGGNGGDSGRSTPALRSMASDRFGSVMRGLRRGADSGGSS